MKLLPLFYTKTVSLLLTLLFLNSYLFSQIDRRIPTRRPTSDLRMYKNVTDTSPLKRAILNKELKINPGLTGVFVRNMLTDTVWSLAPFLQAKENCECE